MTKPPPGIIPLPALVHVIRGLGRPYAAHLSSTSSPISTVLSELVIRGSMDGGSESMEMDFEIHHNEIKEGYHPSKHALFSHSVTYYGTLVHI